MGSQQPGNSGRLNLVHRSARIIFPLLALLALLALAACASAAEPTASPTATPVPAATQPDPAGNSTAAADPVTVTIGEGSTARYRVGEQLARQDLPNDAVGETDEVSGTVVLDATGAVDPSQSRITVNLQTLTRDEDRRDRFIRENSLTSNQFPTAELAITDLPGLPWPLPESGSASFQLAGDLTVHGETRPVTWEVTAEFGGTSLSGTASTTITFDQFNIEKPSLFFIVSVNDEVELELDFEATLAG